MKEEARLPGLRATRHYVMNQFQCINAIVEHIRGQILIRSQTVSSPSQEQIFILAKRADCITPLRLGLNRENHQSSLMGPSEKLLERPPREPFDQSPNPTLSHRNNPVSLSLAALTFSQRDQRIDSRKDHLLARNSRLQCEND
jgi:hypothetical protein